MTRLRQSGEGRPDEAWHGNDPVDRQRLTGSELELTVAEGDRSRTGVNRDAAVLEERHRGEARVRAEQLER